MESSHISTPHVKPIRVNFRYVIWYVLALIEIFLFLRLLMRLFVSDIDTGLMGLLSDITGFLVFPFTSIFGTTETEKNIFKWTTLLSMLVYALIAWGITEIFPKKKETPILSTSKKTVEMNK